MNRTQGVARVGEIELCYESWGKESDPAVLLIMGLGAQMLLWPDSFCENLVNNGYRVIRFDNRDIGLSSKIRIRSQKQNFLVAMARFQLGLRNPSPYTLYDMASDAIGLLDFLKIDKAHVVGASMGGMIAQIVAAKYPDRLRSLNILFSSNNQALLPPPHPGALLPLIKGPGAKAPREVLLDHSVKVFTRIGSPGYPGDPAEIRRFANELMDRSFHPAGVKRHFLAVMGSGSLRSLAPQIKAPTLVVHGKEDKLVRPAGGKAIASSIAGARLELVDGMGHDIPKALVPHLAGLFVSNFRRAA
ncbi:pimeloyl-ACP methyl ester carboxylesterase [Fluviicoccus keumensis]|uniref:Pimeloyl-ACP methyl ester carboxylesterase n=1 Tax=Fluviicoccus keumensis TaxID=1435465 RepID=A0A4Q7Z5H4_9GAMM|nr:alpha/beta hydrolase [Fluviicoccus keumensis]RZU45274.1 pimeloyl-ACP methyl ester carboxylesterase [Fluviicoccus keumensis]